MYIGQNEITEVVKLLDRLKYLDAVRFGVSISAPIDFNARFEHGETKYVAMGVDVKKFIEEQVEKEIKEVVAQLAECGVEATEINNE